MLRLVWLIEVSPSSAAATTMVLTNMIGVNTRNVIVVRMINCFTILKIKKVPGNLTTLALTLLLI